MNETVHIVRVQETMPVWHEWALTVEHPICSLTFQWFKECSQLSDQTDACTQAVHFETFTVTDASIDHTL